MVNMATPTSGSVHVCSFDGCSAVFKKPSKLKEHMRSHTGERPFACTEPGCEKAFTRKSHLARHGLSHSGVKEVRCTWAGCSDQFVSTTSLKKHITRIHEGRPYKCTHADCVKTFHKHRQLRIHEYEHTGILPFPCDKCDKRFLLPSRLNRHLKVHAGYTCRMQDCEATFDKWSVLQAHMKERHNNSYKCEVCGKQFSMHCRLTQHAQIHSPSRDVFPCPLDNCNRTYTKMSNLKTHIQSYHEARRPFSCDQEGCNKTFAHEISLKRHKKAVHDAETSLPPRPRKPRRVNVGRRKSDYPGRLLGYKEQTSSAEPARQDDDSVHPVLLRTAEELTATESSSHCETLHEEGDVTCHEAETSIETAADMLAEEKNPDLSDGEDIAVEKESVEGDLMCETLHEEGEASTSVETAADRPAEEQKPGLSQSDGENITEGKESVEGDLLCETLHDEGDVTCHEGETSTSVETAADMLAEEQNPGLSDGEDIAEGKESVEGGLLCEASETVDLAEEGGLDSTGTVDPSTSSRAVGSLNTDDEDITEGNESVEGDLMCETSETVDPDEEGGNVDNTSTADCTDNINRSEAVGGLNTCSETMVPKEQDGQDHQSEGVHLRVMA